jgi:hypothetical protein
MKAVRRRLTFANVISCLALFVALSGAAYAAGLSKNSVGTKQIKNEAVTAAKVKKGSLTGAQINVSTLGTVPTATHANIADQATSATKADEATTATNATHATTAGQATSATNATHATTAEEATTAENAENSGQLGGIGPTGFIQGSGNIIRGYESTSSPDGSTLMTIPNLGEVRVDCSGEDNRIAFFPSVSGSLWFTSGGAAGYVNGSSGTQLANQATASLITAQFATATETTTMFISGNPGATCTYAGQAIVQP